VIFKVDVPTGFRLYDDPRELALRDAFYGCLR